MLLNRFTAINSRGALLDLPLEEISGGILVKGIDGLDPVKATLVSSSFANQDGEQYHSSRRESRNVIVHLGLDPDYAVASVKEIRDQLYQYFMPKTEVLLGFNMFDRFSEDLLTQNLFLNIAGRVESLDSPLFTADPVADISIMCFDPDFYDPNVVIFDGATVADMTTSVLSYVGSVDTGVLFTLNVNRVMAEFTIYHTPPDGKMISIDVQYPFVAGDVVKLSSIAGNKYLTLTRAGTETSILYALLPSSGWLELQPGDNDLRVYATGAAVPFEIQYNTKYGGL